MRCGIRFEPDWAPEELPALARWAEEVGYDELWFSEDLPWAGGIAMAATALACTSTLHIGLGLLPATTRNPATTAMEIAALARLAPGRLTVALGSGIPSWMEQIGAAAPRPLMALQETTAALRGLLEGQTVTVNGEHVHLQGVRLGFPPAVVPRVLLGTTGPRGLRTAGSSADGVLLPEIASPAAVSWAREQITEGAKTASVGVPQGTAATAEVSLLAMVSLGDDAASAVAQVRSRLRRIVDFGVFTHLTDMPDLPVDAEGRMSDEVVQRVAAAGTPADALRAMRAWEAAGAAAVILVAGADDPQDSYRRFAEEVLPHL
jgi:5,10-methylenetetrahydromethanopterin reductase